jgi:23S rRNA (adenine2503-C2)-methyltransferase
MVKITPIHITKSTEQNNLQTSKGYFDYEPYRQVEQDLKNRGFDVLVFIPSIEEDTSRITCGNAILSDMINQ